LTGLGFPWVLIGLAAVVDLVGFFYLWRRRNFVGTNHRAVRKNAARPLRIPLAERRRRERRGTGKAAAV
jgi:hypothetical protein